MAAARQRAALAANAELIHLYWRIGRDILERQQVQGWGGKVIERLARDLREAFPEMKGFSHANLLYMRAFAQAWPDAEIVQRTVGQLPWGHNVLLITRLKDPALRLRYAEQARAEGWSRTTLELSMQNRLTALRAPRARMPAWSSRYSVQSNRWKPLPKAAASAN